jgi:hypothetical protein
MQITRDWLDSISDENGLTPGQQKLLAIWAQLPYVEKMIPDQIARFLEGCKGYRKMPQELRELIRPM